MASDIKSHDVEGRSAAKLPTIDFSSVLARTIESIHDDPAQLRNAVYELARVKLQREAWQHNPPMNLLEMRRLMLALETAIERVETLSSQQDELRSLQDPQRRLLDGGSSNAQVFFDDALHPVEIIEQFPAGKREARHVR